MKQLNNNELKDVQIRLLLRLHNFCIDNGIRYSLCAGTLLGAVRHNGFIPWDDDIDVMMPRKDYERFLELFASDKETLYHFQKQNNYVLPFAKLCDNSTIVKENVVYESDYGVDIDVFPLDYFPASIEESKRWATRIKRLMGVHTIKNMKCSINRSFIKNLIVLACRLFLLPIPMKRLTERINAVIQQYDDEEGEYLGNLTMGYGFRERTNKAKGLLDIEFEGKKFKAIDNYDSYLTNLYGDYMTLPPEEKRISTHTITAYWK